MRYERLATRIVKRISNWIETLIEVSDNDPDAKCRGISPH